MDIDLSQANIKRVTELDFELQEQKAKIEDKAIMVTSKKQSQQIQKSLSKFQLIWTKTASVSLRNTLVS